jgi:hypothetical protein
MIVALKPPGEHKTDQRDGRDNFFRGCSVHSADTITLRNILWGCFLGFMLVLASGLLLGILSK